MNVSGLLLRQMQHRPDALAVNHASGKLTYGAFGSRVLLASGGLLAAGVAANEVVAVRLDDPLDHWLAALALAHMGAAVLSIPRSMPGAQRERLMKLTHCTRVLEGDEYGNLRESFGLPTLRWSLVKDHPATSSDAAAAVAPDQPWLFVSGSGSTGRPKIMPVTHQQQWLRATLGPKWLPYGSDDVLLPLVSMDFYAPKQRCLEVLAQGAAVFLDTPGHIDHREAVANGDVTAIYGMVSHIETLLRSLPLQDQLHYGRLRALMLGGSSVSMGLREQIRQRLTPRLYVLWGANECHTATITRLSEVFSTAGGVGHPVPGFAAEIIDSSGIPVTPGVEGRVRVASPTAINGYLDDPEATQKAFCEGWFYPGDIGHFTPDGQLVHRGRADDMMIVSGVNVYPAEIEECLRAQPGVADVLATPLRHAVLQDLPVALVVPAPGVKLDTQTLVSHVRNQIGGHALYDLVFVERIPRNDQGKLQSEQVGQILNSKWGKPALSPGNLKDAQRHASLKPSGTLEIGFKLPPGARPGAVMEWLAVLGETVDPGQYSQQTAQALEAARNWLEQVLKLAGALLHVLFIPVFNPIEIVDCRSATEDGDRWQAVCRLPDTALAPHDVMQGVIKVAFGLAAWACQGKVTDARDRDRFFRVIEKDILQAFAKAKPHGGSAFEALRAAHSLGIPYRQLAAGVFQLGWGSHAVRFDGSAAQGDSAAGRRRRQNKLLTAQLLRKAGLPAPLHQRVQSLVAAQEVAESLGFPVVVKPADMERGEGVTVDVRADGLETAFNEAHRRSPGKMVLVEQQTAGVCHRLFIAAGELLYAVRRLPNGIYADGQSAIIDLVESECQTQQRLPPWKRSGIRPLDEIALRMLARQGWGPGTVPQAGQFVALLPRDNQDETAAWSGPVEEMTNNLHPDNVRAAVTAAELFGLEVAGVDMISRDITQPWHANGGIITEVSYAPLLGGGEVSRRYVSEYLSRILKDRGRIPVHVYVGGELAWRAANQRWERLRASGVAAYLTNEMQTLDGRGQSCALTSAGLSARVQALLLRRDVQALVMVLQKAQTLREGPPVDRVSSLMVVDHELSFEQSATSSTASQEVADLIAACRTWWAKDPSSESSEYGTAKAWKAV